MPNYWLRQLYATVFLFAAPFVICTLGSLSIGYVAGAFLLSALLTAYGYNIGSHYTFTHRIFKFSRAAEWVLVYLSTVSACASPLSWAVHHMAHHRYTETEFDPHSPSQLGWKALFATNYKTAKVDFAPVRHLVRDPLQRFADSELGFWAITLSWPAIAFILAGVQGLVWFWLVPIWYVLFVAVAFVFGHTGPYDQHSKSRAINSWLLGFLSLGDGDHLEHHRNMRACGRGTRFVAKLAGAK